MLDNNKKNVLFIVPTLGRGGAETQLIDLANDIDSTKFNKTLVVFDRNIDQLSRVDKQTVDFHHYFRKSKFDITIFRKIARLIDEKEIDVIHSTIQVSMLVAIIALLLANRKPKILLAIHTTVNFNKKYEFTDRFLYRYLMRYCKNIIFVCNNQADYWCGRFPEIRSSSVVIYNGVDTDFFNRKNFISSGIFLRKKLSISDDATVITCVAGFRIEKGHQYLIEAFSQLEADGYLLFVGDGVTRKSMEALVRKNNLESRIIFLGELADVRSVLAASDATVLASTSETFSMAMLESMSMGVPMIATDTGGLSEAIIPGETGDLVPSKDSVLLANVLLRYMNKRKYTSSMGRKARELVVDKFSKEAMVSQTEKILMEGF